MKLGDSGGWLIEVLQMSVTMLGSDRSGFKSLFYRFEKFEFGI